MQFGIGGMRITKVNNRIFYSDNSPSIVLLRELRNGRLLYPKDCYSRLETKIMVKSPFKLYYCMIILYY